MKTVLLVPGFMEDRTTRNYGAVLKAIEQAGYKTKFINITWKYKAINDWVAELESVYKKYDPKETILAGFSFGSMTALVAASKQLPAELWLLSLSPYFSEDLPFIKPVWLGEYGKHRVEQFRHVSFDKLYPAITCPVKLFAGEKEMQKYPDIERRFEDATKKFKNCESIMVQAAGHQLDHPNYIKAIKEHI